MDSVVVDLFKSFVEWFKESWYFLFCEEKPIKTVGGVNSLILFLSKHSSYRELAFKTLRAILFNNSKKKSFNKKRRIIKNEITKIGSSANVSSNEEVIYFINYLKNNQISFEDLTVQKITFFFNNLVMKINVWKRYARDFSIILFIFSLILSCLFDYSFLLLLGLIVIIIPIIKAQEFYCLYLSVKNITIQEVDFEKSIYYSLIKEYDSEWFRKISRDNSLKITVQEQVVEIDKKDIEEELFNLKISKGNIRTQDITDSDLYFLTKVVDKGEFKIINHIDSFQSKTDVLVKTFNYVCKNDNKEHLFHNVWKILKDKSSCHGIYKWFSINKSKVSSLIDSTPNKRNVLHLFTTINDIKNYQLKNSSDKSQWIFSNVDKIEDTVLENMSLDNFIDIFKAIEESQKSDSPIVLINKGI